MVKAQIELIFSENGITTSDDIKDKVLYFGTTQNSKIYPNDEIIETIEYLPLTNLLKVSKLGSDRGHNDNPIFKNKKIEYIDGTDINVIYVVVK